MSNVLSEDKQQQVVALGRLGWSLRRIERETGVRRETGGGYSRKCVRLLTFRSSTRIWAELHERAFRRLGGATRLVVLDNLREGVLARRVTAPSRK